MMINILVDDKGFQPFKQNNAKQLIATDKPEDLIETVSEENEVTIHFESAADGRGFSIARRLRELGYGGKIYASGALICDQYRHARQSGFDGVLLTVEQAIRMPQSHWLENAKRVPVSYRKRLYAA